MKIIINRCYGGFGLSHKVYEAMGWDDGIPEEIEDEEHFRTIPKLIEVIEQLGDEANDKHSKLKIVEVPDDVKWYIEEYDGMESIHELHRYWC